MYVRMYVCMYVCVKLHVEGSGHVASLGGGEPPSFNYPTLTTPSFANLV